MPDANAKRGHNHSDSIQAVHGGVAGYYPGDRFGPRTLADFELVWIIQGSAVYEHDGTRHNLAQGDAVLARPGFEETYQWDRKHDSRHAFVHFELVQPPHDWPDLEAWPVTQRLDPAGAVVTLLRQVISHWCLLAQRDPRQAAPWVQRAILTMVDLWLAGDPSPAVNASWCRPVRMAVEWVTAQLRHDPAVPIALEQLAEAAHVHPSHLVRQFRRDMGMTPMRTVQAMRLDAARVMLLRSNLTVQEVAYRFGFASPFHFSRVFKSQFGKSPSQVRTNSNESDVINTAARIGRVAPIDW